MPGHSIRDSPSKHEARNALLLKRRIRQLMRTESNNGGQTLSAKLDANTTTLVHSEWCLFLNFYTNCYLTEGKDVLVALEGVAHEVARVLQENLFHGMCTTDWNNGLCWYVRLEESPRRPPYISAPSWSWVSSTRPILWPHGGWSEEDIYSPTRAVVTELIHHVSSDGTQRESINIQCSPIPIKIGSQSQILFDELPGCEVVFFPDKITTFDMHSSSDGTAYVIPLRYERRKSEVLTIMGGLLVVPSNEWIGAYMRIGYCELSQQYVGPEHEQRSTLKRICDSLSSQTIELA